MPTLTERELSNVEKLFNATRALLTYTREKRKYHHERARQNRLDGGKASAIRNEAVDDILPLPMVSPSLVLDGSVSFKAQQQQQQQQSRRQPASPRGNSGRSSGPLSSAVASSTAAAGGGPFSPSPATEKRLWAELASVFWRIAGLSKLTLLSYVTSDPCSTLQEVGTELLDYIQAFFHSCQKGQRLEEVAKLGADHVLYMLKKLCSRRMCILMLGGDSSEGKKLHRAVCKHMVEKHHITWMSLLYVSFCEQAAYRDAHRLYMPSTYVSTVSDVLRSLYHACAEDAACAREMLYSEPVSCVTYMFYGLKLRIQKGELLRPSEADDATLMSEGGPDTPLPSSQIIPQRRSTRQALASHSFPLVDKFNVQRTPRALVAATAFASAHLAAASAGSPAASSPYASRSGGAASSDDSTRAPNAATSGAASDSRRGGSSSWGMNLPTLSRQQLGHLMLAGRQNCYDELCHLALDVAVEAVRNANGYQHWAIMSTIASVTTLSVKSLEGAAANESASRAIAPPTVGETLGAAGTSGMMPSPLGGGGAGEGTGQQIAKPLGSTFSSSTLTPEKLTQTTKQVAMYENVLDIVQLVMALLKGLAVEPKDSDVSPASHSLSLAGAEAVVRVSAEAMNELQQNRETFLQDLLKGYLAAHLKSAVTAAPKIILADRSLMCLIEEFCTLDKARESEWGLHNGDGAAPAGGAGGAGGSVYPPGLADMASLSFQPGMSYAAGGGGPVSSFSLGLAGGGGSQNRAPPPNLSLAGPRGDANSGIVDEVGTPRTPGSGAAKRKRAVVAASTSGGGGVTAAKGSNKHSGRAGPGKENFAKSFFKSFFRKGSTSDLHAGVASEGGEGDEDSGADSSGPPDSGGGGTAGREGEHAPEASDSSVVFSSTTRRMAAEATTLWAEVPSYVAIVNEIAASLNEMFVDTSLDVELRMVAGFILPPVCLRDAMTFERYEGRVTLRNIARVMEEQVRQHVTSSGGRAGRPSGGSAGLESAEKELNTYSFLGFVNRALLSLERAYKVIGVPPLTSEAVAFTELPLYFFCADGASQPGMSLEKYFTRVVSLWSVAIMGAESDEDLDSRSMEVLVEILERAIHRGSMPKDSGSDSGNTNAVTSSATEAATTSSNSSRADGLLLRNDNSRIPGASAPGLSGTMGSASCRGSNSSLFGNGSAHFLSTLGADGQTPATLMTMHESSLSEHANTLVALSHVCVTLLHRKPLLLTPETLTLFFTLFHSHDTNLARLGRECVLGTFDLPEAYGGYAAMIDKEEDAHQMGSLVALLASYLSSDKLHQDTRHERRVWMATKGCVRAVIGAITRCLRSPQLYATIFMKLVPQLFRLLSAFEPSQDMSPQLAETDFIEVVSNSVGELHGAEYFIIVTQSVFDAATCNYGAEGGKSAYNLNVVGNFRLSANRYAAVKTIFLELVPALAQYALARGHDLYTNVLEVFAQVVRFTTNIHSPRLVDFVLANHLSDLLPYMELTARVLETLPFTGASAELRSFWCPILINAPLQSEIHFSVSGGVVVTIGQWPETGLTLAFNIKFDTTHTNLPLLELRSHDTPQLADSSLALSVTGGDSVQLTSRGVRTTVNQSHSAQTFKPGCWLNVCVVFSNASQTLTVFLNGFHVGVATGVPCPSADAEVTVGIGPGEKLLQDACFSLGEVALWGEELSAPQVEAYLAASDAVRFPAKVRVCEIPRELSGTSAPLPVDSRLARFIPYENENQMLRNLIKRDPPSLVVAKIVGRHSALPQSWVDYHMLWATRGGILRMIDWLDDATTPEELDMVLRLIAETVRRVTLLTTVDARMYILLSYMLKCNAGLMTAVACESVLHLGTSHVVFNDEDQCVIINRLLFEYVLSDCSVLAKMPCAAAIHLLDRLGAMFNPGICRHAKRNAQFIVPYRFVDRLLNTLVTYAVVMPLQLRMGVVNVAKQVLVACELEESVLSIFTAMSAVLTPMEQTVSSVYNTAIKVVLPSLRHTRVRLLPLRTAESTSALLLRALVECSALTHNVFVVSFPRVITLSWLAACLGRFADPVGVVYAIGLFFDAMQSSPDLKAEVMGNQQTIVDALQPHAAHSDVVLVLLAVTLGAFRHLNLLSQRFSVREQLDSVLCSFTCTEPNAVVAPIFVKLFILHLHTIISVEGGGGGGGGGARGSTEQSTSTVLQRHQSSSLRIRRYFSLARVCSRLMLLIHLKRYRATVQRHMLRAQWRDRGGDAAAAIVAATGSSSFASDVCPLSGPPLAAATDSFALRGDATALSNAMASVAQPDDDAAARRTEREAETAQTEGETHGTGDARHNGKEEEEELPAPLADPAQGVEQLVKRTDDVAQHTEEFTAANRRIRSGKYKRAFAVLRVCVLLWIPTQVSRYDWIFKPHAPSSERELSKRHASTIFAMKAFRKYAEQPSLFYTFVSSPMETAALSSLVNFVSKSLLHSKMSEWKQFLEEINPAPAREVSADFAGTVSTGGDTLVNSPTSPPVNDAAQFSSTPPLAPATADTADDGDDESDPQRAERRSRRKTRGSSAAAVLGTPLASPTAPASQTFLGTSPTTAAGPVDPLPASKNSTAGASSLTSPVLAVTNASGTLAKLEGTTTAAAAPSEASSPPHSPLSADPHPHTTSSEDGAAAAAILAAYVRLSHGGGVLDEVDADDAASGPPTVEATAIPAGRRAATGGAAAAPSIAAALQSRQISMLSQGSGRGPRDDPLEDSLPHRLPSSPVSRASVASDSIDARSVSSSKQSSSSKRQRRGRRGTALFARQSSRAGPPSGEDEDNVDGSNDGSNDGSSSSDDVDDADDSDFDDTAEDTDNDPRYSAASLRVDLPGSATATTTTRTTTGDGGLTGLTTSSPSGDTASTVKAVVGTGTDATDGAAALDLSDVQDPSAVYIENMDSAIATVGDVVRRGAIGVLASLVGGALHVLPMPQWIGGPTYGTCGGFLFQMLLVTSSTAPGEENTATLIKYFLLKVAEKVKEEQGSFLDFPFGCADGDGAGSAGGDINASFASASSGVAGHSQALHESFAHGAGAGAGLAASPYSSLSASMRGLLTLPTNASLARGTSSSFASGGSGVTPSQQPSTVVSDVFYFNVIHFTELVVDMISINVLDLPTANNYFLTLLVLCQSWPKRHIEQLSGQVLRTCIAVLNRPSTQEFTVPLMESIYTLTTLVLRRGFMMKGAIDSLFRVLYRVYASLPPAWMSESDAQRRKSLVVLIFRHIMQTYAKTRELQKALQVRTLTQRFSLYNDFAKALLTNTEREACAAFGKYCEDNATSMDTLMAGRPKQKADLALKANIRIRGEYIKRVKAFNASYLAAIEVKEGRRPHELRAAFHARFSSFTVNAPVLEPSQLHWLAANNSVLRERKVGLEDGTVGEVQKHHELIVHYLDSQRNYATVSQTRRHTHVVDNVDVLRATLCEEQVNHISVLVPPFTMRCRPYLSETPPNFIDPKIHLSPSGLTLLSLLLDPNETLRFISNAFRINGLHATPCLVLLTNFTLKVISFSRVTQEGDIILSEYATGAAAGGGEGAASGRASSSAGDLSKSSSLPDLEEVNSSSSGGGGHGLPMQAKAKQRSSFSIAKMTKQLQRLLLDDHREKRERQLVRDGTRVAQSVRQSTGPTYRQLFWMYMLASLHEVRCVHYMHLDTAVLLTTNHDDGPMLSFVDATQSMNSAARAEFLSVLKDVMRGRQCTFVDGAQRPASLRRMLVRWATGALSNYEYLTFLNRVAGRTIKDFNQYPVFPWVLRDYTSGTLDLESATTFRDLSFPMGAQTDTRREMVSQFYHNTVEMWQSSEEAGEEGAECFPFHHGTHYSTSAGVLYYFLRVEPFTTFAKVFQGGDFDIATRLFDSIAASYASCVLGPADCKELLPEFYYNNMFLLNADHVDFGTKADGEVVDSVKLPPWAKGSVQVFTAVMRYALESGFVQQNIHQWIDLIFGVRRRGPLALEKLNVFQRMTYGEEVAKALQTAQTPHDIDVIIAEVDNFGQTPVQLFQERHPSHHELEPGKPMSVSSSSGGGGGGGGGASSPHINTLFLSLTSAIGSGSGGDGRGPATTPGATSANLANPSANATGTAAGQTYTLAYAREAPKVMRMMVHSLDTPQVCFRLTDIPAQRRMPGAPANGLADYFRGADPAVTCFATLHVSPAPAAQGTTGSAPSFSSFASSAGSAFASGTHATTAAGGLPLPASQAALQPRLACGYRRMVPVQDEAHYICWHERENRLMRFCAVTGRFQSLIPFECPEESSQHITAVGVAARESLMLVAVASGTIYCLYPDTSAGLVHLSATLCYHTHPVAGFAIDSHFGRAISYTHSPDDMPIVWRLQRFHSSLLYVLDLRDLLPCLCKQPPQHHEGKEEEGRRKEEEEEIIPTPAPLGKEGEAGATAASPPETTTPPPPRGIGARAPSEVLADLAVMHACIDHTSAFSVLITKRSLFIFDNNGHPFGAGSLPTPKGGLSAEAAASGALPLMLEDDDGEIGLVAEKEAPYVANMTVVLAYHTREWAAGMQLFVTGHQDGSLSIWRSTRLPPDTVEPGRIAVVDFHAVIFSGATVNSDTPLGFPTPDSPRPPSSGGVVANDSTGSTSNSLVLGAVTAIQQEKLDIPEFLVGFQNGATKLLTFDEGLFQPEADSGRRR